MLSNISTIAVENAHYTVPEYIKTYVRNEIVAKTIFIFLIISMIYYIFVRKIGLLFVYSWISAISFCLCAEVWLAIDNFYGGTFENYLEHEFLKMDKILDNTQERMENAGIWKDLIC